MSDITDYEAQQIEEANASELTPVVFIHGLWLLPSSWDRWRTVFEEAGYVTLAPGWPDDPGTVKDANMHPEVLARKSVGQIADHFGDVIGKLTTKPALIGHSFGGLLTQILAGRGAAAPFFLHDRGSEEVVRFISRRLRGCEPAGRNELRHDIELVEQLGVEDAPALVAFQGAVPVGRRVECVPADEHGAGLFLRVEPQQEISEADDCAAALVAAPSDRFRQCMVGAVRKRVAIDDEQRPVHG